MLIEEKKIASGHEAGPATSITLSDDGSGMLNAYSFKPTHEMINSDFDTLTNRLEIFGVICLSGYCAELKFKNKRLNGLMTISNPNKESYTENDIDSLKNEINKANKILKKNIMMISFFI
ncbi:hypothetical protein SAMN04488062_102273 [Flavobacterium omnivorum]|uniref:Uncharacterized protein n=1 Tax=Flavobacterium omnivorum TaxID=178355 RepID=A0A1G7XE32_9FLAO|nr:hypothetical protein [Flavobacterium omnivorum]SDG82406.1 hypothetical protein SAMN04488062_102273 [Flavobacterium omnivorum]